MEFGSVRRGQLITTYGVGALVAIDNSSGMIAGLHRWRVDDQPPIHEPRLQHVLGVRRFVGPPTKDPQKQHWQTDRNVPIVRFPTYFWCPDCRRLDKYQKLTSEINGKCNRCDTGLVPSRFIICCDHGHIDDFPYLEWVHEGKTPSSGHVLEVRTAGVSASLADIEIVCSCGKTRSMEDAFSPKAFQGWLWCRGRRPWIGDFEKGCTQLPRTAQRGASNVYFPLTASSISIPPWSEPAQKFIEQNWRVLQHIPDEAIVPTLDGMDVERDTGFTPGEVARMIMERRQGRVQFATSEEDLRRQEYAALVNGRKEESKNQDFVCIPAEGQFEVQDLFEKVMVVTRLREVRVLRGFTRLRPPESGEPARIARLSPGGEDWLPAIEVLGEGVFFKLHEEKLKEWMNGNSALDQRMELLKRNYLRHCKALAIPPSHNITPRFVLLHTLAHILIDQWALDSGYPTGSLRERLYSSDEDGDQAMAGVMIYTAASDSAGSLGGVVSRASKDRLLESIREAYSRAQWCSSDPLCIESEGRGVDSLNLAACHACCLLPETSCEHQNMYLDRALIVGTPEHPELGFLRPVFEGT